MPTTPITTAIIEMNSQTDILRNLLDIEQGVIAACAHQADLVVLPENAFSFGHQQQTAGYFDALSAWCGRLAAHYGIHLLAGTLPCPYRPDGSVVADGKLRQSSLLFDASGERLARYDKIHLFKATVSDSTGRYDEGETFEAGNQPVVAKTALGSIGMMVCFDLRFAPLALRLRQLGADILTAPSAFTYATGQAHWRHLLTARALDSQCMVIGAAQAGTHYLKPDADNARQTWGHSEVISANGEAISHSTQPMTVPIDSHQTLDISQLPVCQTALSFLADSLTDVNSQSLINQDAIRVLLAKFDADAQQKNRQDIALMTAQRFTVSDPKS